MHDNKDQVHDEAGIFDEGTGGGGCIDRRGGRVGGRFIDIIADFGDTYHVEGRSCSQEHPEYEGLEPMRFITFVSRGPPRDNCLPRISEVVSPQEMIQIIPFDNDRVQCV